MEAPREKIGDFVRMEELTQAKLKELVNYDPETGKMVWASKYCQRIVVGKEVGYETDRGYRVVMILGKNYYVHRLIWLYVHGEFPKHDVDHKDGDTRNNKIANLRTATRSQNNANKIKQTNNKSGYKGVWWCKYNKRFVAEISSGGVRRCLGYYRSAEDAARAYDKAAKDLFGEFGVMNGV